MPRFGYVGKAAHLCFIINNNNNTMNNTQEINNGKVNKMFIESIDRQIGLDILVAIKEHYGIPFQNVLDEVYDSEAENILEYLTGEIRATAAILFKKWLMSLIAK